MSETRIASPFSGNGKRGNRDGVGHGPPRKSARAESTRRNAFAQMAADLRRAYAEAGGDEATALKIFVRRRGEVTGDKWTLSVKSGGREPKHLDPDLLEEAKRMTERGCTRWYAGTTLARRVGGDDGSGDRKAVRRLRDLIIDRLKKLSVNAFFE